MAEVLVAEPASDKPGAVVCDLDGVIYVERVGIPGAGGALQRIQTAGIEIIFVTNNSSKTRQMVADDVAAATGFQADPANVVTSGLATAHYAKHHVSAVLLVGGKGLRAELVEVGIEIVEEWSRADAVVVGLDRDVTYEKLRKATLALRAGAAFIATNTDATYPGREGLYPGGGAIVAALETASGLPPVVCGKPFGPTRTLVRSLVGSRRAVVVGDRPETDLAIAHKEGWGSILVMTGVTSSVEDIDPTLAPDMVLESVADLPQYLGLD